jgi:hypothetical protein
MPKQSRDHSKYFFESAMPTIMQVSFWTLCATVAVSLSIVLGDPFYLPLPRVPAKSSQLVLYIKESEFRK